jgi:protein SCO1/2
MSRSFIHLTLVLLTAVAVLLPGSLRAQILMDEVPAAARGIDVEDRVGEFIPLNLMFKDERGTPIPLARFFKQDKPIVLTMNYSDCPGLCMAQLNNLVDTLREMNGSGLGEKFEMISVSIDPTESHTKAALTKQKYVGLLAEDGAEKGWHFLTGEQKSITELAKALGFHYSYDKASKRYSHASVTYFISPDGRICRYFLSLKEEPEQFKFALNDAGEGKLATSLSDTFVQMCYSYDPLANRYTADARRLLSFAAGAFSLMLIGFTAPFWFSSKNKTVAPPANESTSLPGDSLPASAGAEASGLSASSATQSVVPVQNDPQQSARQER